MKRLAEKFDHLPQDFDREVIWKGIEKPEHLFVFRIYFWGPLLVAATGVLYFILAPSNTPVVPAAQPNSARVTTVCPDEEILALMEAEPSNTDFEIAPKRKPPGSPTPIDPTNEAKEMRSLVNRVRTENEAVTIENTDPKELERAKPAPLLPLLARPDTELREMVAPLPKRSFPVALSLNDPSFNNRVKIGIKRKRGKQSLAFRAGIGVHRTDFSSATGEDPIWRKNLEKSQLDYSLGLRYERVLKQNYLFSVSAMYHLYKDKINTTYVREGMGKDTLISYRLYNHYHLLSGQVAVGRRFYQKEFFWDIQGGLGVTYHQSAQLDYFVREGELADELQIERDYQSGTDVFFKGEAAIGKQLSPRMYVRMGTQINSRRELTAPQAAIRHRILPVDAFLELGIRF